MTTLESSRPARVRDQRLEIRCYAEEKNLLRQAAELDRRTLSNWLLHVAMREARKMVEGDASSSRAEKAIDSTAGDSTSTSPAP